MIQYNYEASILFSNFRLGVTENLSISCHLDMVRLSQSHVGTTFPSFFFNGMIIFRQKSSINHIFLSCFIKYTERSTFPQFIYRNINRDQSLSPIRSIGNFTHTHSSPVPKPENRRQIVSADENRRARWSGTRRTVHRRHRHRHRRGNGERAASARRAYVPGCNLHADAAFAAYRHGAPRAPPAAATT